MRTSSQFTLTLIFAFLALKKSFAAPPPQPWAGAALSDWSNSAQAIVLSDLSRCEPATALSEMRLRRERWKVIPYEMAAGGYTGKMIWASAETHSPEVSLPLSVDGWHAIFVGLFSATEVPTTAWLRLDTEVASVPRYNARVSPRPYGYGHSEEVFFRAARLRKDSRLCIRPQTTGETAACGVTHIKLIPLTPDEIARVEADTREPAARTLIATHDGFSDFFHRSPRTEGELLSSVEIFRHTDFGTLILQSGGGDKVNYHDTAAGYPWGRGAESYPRTGDRHFVESMRALADRKINPIQSLTKHAQALGLKVHVGIRPAGWDFFEPYSDFWQSPFYEKHPEWRCEDRDGTSVTRMSWAVPEVRRHLLELFREMLEFGADGANIVFTRGYPVVLYEAPARQLFAAQHQGVDLRQVPETDPRVLAFRAGIVTQFIQELRAVLDQEQKRRGVDRRLALSVLINATAQDDLFFGVDLGRLIDAKLVDAVYTERGFGATSDHFNLPFLREVCAPAAIPFAPGIYSAGTRYKTVLPRYFDSGARGLTVWDAEVRDIYEWSWMTRFGHVDETRWRLKNLDLAKPPRVLHLFHKLGTQVRDGRYGAHWGG